MIIAPGLMAEDVKESVNPEFTGNLRINMSFSKAATSHRILLLLGDTQAILKINLGHQMYSDVKA